MAPLSCELSARTLRGIANIAAIGASGASAEERVQEAFTQLRGIFPYDAGIVCAADPVTGERRPLVTSGYPQRMVDYLCSASWHTEGVEPFTLRPGRPVRGCDLPVDHDRLRVAWEYGFPAGLYEGLLSALVAPDGRYVGFVMLSWSYPRSPDEEPRSAVGYLAPTLANIADPVQSARRLVDALGEDVSAIAFWGRDGASHLCGEPRPELLGADGPLRRLVEPVAAGRRPTIAFIWPKNGGGWYGCSAFRCRDGVTVVAVRERSDVHRLTRRELETLAGLVDGSSNAEIAAQLGITTRTVRAHVQRILEKLEVQTRSAAVARALQEGLLLPSS